jgi:NitT/TauT family transport system ATP-binding protein
MPNNGQAFIEVTGVSHTFADGVKAIADVTLTIPTGSFVTLVGKSGVGKSTLLRVLGGLLSPTAGRVQMNGHRGTVQDNIRLPLELGGVSRAEAAPRVQELIELVGLAGSDESYPAQLSGGMDQRMALARALVHRPSLLLLDEPFGALDALTRERMSSELLRIWHAMPVTVFMVTHSIPEAVFLADEVLVMDGTPGIISSRVPVSLPRPRKPAMQSEPEFHATAAAVRAAIEGRLNGTNGQELLGW